MKKKAKRPACACGDHCQDNPVLASLHHFWHFYHRRVPNCRHCKPERRKK